MTDKATILQVLEEVAEGRWCGVLNAPQPTSEEVCARRTLAV